MAGKIHIGTSGFYYEHWRGAFYPEDLPKRKFFNYFVQHFDTVEMNSTFYHLPKAKTIEHWAQKVPKDFLFSFKAYRAITHYKKLQDSKEDLYLFLHLLKPIKPKIGMILFQLPPSLHKDTKRLVNFLQILPKGYRYAMEFRHKSWYEEEIYELLKRFDVSFCIHDYIDTPKIITNQRIYVRFHGASGRYRGEYGMALQEWADFFKKHPNKEIFCYFNNDFEAAAIKDALLLRSLLEA